MRRDCFPFPLVFPVELIFFVAFGIAGQVVYSQVDYEKKTSFEKFISEFSTDSIFQLSRIQFPLEIIENNDTTFLRAEEWGFRPYGFGHEFSTILFADRIDYEKAFYTLVNDTFIEISAFFIKQFHFKKMVFKLVGGEWSLYQLMLSEVQSSENECFFRFIRSFFSDYEFRVGRVASGANYCYLDEGMNIVTRLISVNDLVDSHEYLIKCMYVEVPDLDSEVRILFVKGEGTGYHTEYYFRIVDGKWYLSKEVNLGV